MPTTSSSSAILQSGLCALAWLTADAAALDDTRRILNELEEASRGTVAVNAREMTGVDPETYQRADRGDRQDQKRLVRELFTSRASLATATFSAVPLERDVIALFLAHDRLASGATDVTPAEIEESIQRARAIGSEAALTFFLGVWSQLAAQSGHLQDAIPVARATLALAAKLADGDEQMQDRSGRTALLLSQLYHHAGESSLAAAVWTEHHEAVRGHLDREARTDRDVEPDGDAVSKADARPPTLSGETPESAAAASPPRSAVPPAER